MREALEQRGAKVLVTPLIRLSDVSDWSEADPCLKRITEYQWLVFTSARAAQSLLGRANALGIGIGAFSGCKIACVGPGTARAVKETGLAVDLQPATHNNTGMTHELRMLGLKPGSRVLSPRGNLANEGAVESMRAAGVAVDTPLVYVNEPDPEGARELATALGSGALDAVAFASPSAVHNAMTALDDAAKQALRRLRIYSIGPATTEALKSAGLGVTREAQPHNFEGMLAAIESGESGRGP